MFPLTPPHTGRHLFFGLDLGKLHDHSALVILERIIQPPGTPRRLRLVLRHADRFPLGLPYLEIVRRVVKEIGETAGELRSPWQPTHEKQCPHKSLLPSPTDLVIDASGVGAPVVELLRAARLHATLVPITITASGEPHPDRVSRQDLVTNLRVLLESGILRIPPALHHLDALTAELLNFSSASTDKHDDLAIALALAAWRAAANLSPTLKREQLLCLP